LDHRQIPTTPSSVLSTYWRNWGCFCVLLLPHMRAAPFNTDSYYRFI